MRKELLSKVLLVSAFGYLVDIYDLILFGIVRIPSLKEFGYSGDEVFSKGILLANSQLAGLLLGGILWGILGDRAGRVKALFGSILLFSVANFWNAFVHSLDAYIVCRFLAGVGLAGELGIGITITAESLPSNLRGHGAALITGIGMMGALVASLVSGIYGWRSAYCVGGILGLSVLTLRKNVVDTEIFREVRTQMQGMRRAFLPTKEGLVKYMRCVAMGVPTQFITGILIVFSPELMANRDLDYPINLNLAVIACYTGVAIGAGSSGTMSRYFQTRKRVVLGFLLFTLLAVIVFILAPYSSVRTFYLLCAFLGLGCGFWPVAILICAELFGTDVRATATTTVPNFTRAVLILLTVSFAWLKAKVGMSSAGLFLGMIVLGMALAGAFGLEETYGKDLQFKEA
jgi:MFS family permease